MKKIVLILLFLLIFVPGNLTYATDYRDIDSYPAGSENRPLNFGGFLTVYFNSIAEYESIPESYRYIRLNFQNVKENTPLYSALQKGVYMGFFKNLPINLKTKELATPEQFARAVESNLGQKMEISGSGNLTL